MADNPFAQYAPRQNKQSNPFAKFSTDVSKQDQTEKQKADNSVKQNPYEFGSLKSLFTTLSGSPHDIDLSKENIEKAARKAAIKTAQQAYMLPAWAVGGKMLGASLSDLSEGLGPKYEKFSQGLKGAYETSPFRKWADKVGLEIKGKDEKAVQKSIEDYFSQAKSKAVKFINPTDEKFSPIQANREISKAYKAEIEHSTNLWNGVKAAWRGEKIKDNGVMEDVSNLIDELKSTPVVGEERSGAHVAVKDLENIQKNLNTEPITEKKPIKAAEVGTRKMKFDYDPEKGLIEVVPKGHNLKVQDLIDLKKTLNQHYDPKSFRTSEDAPYIKLNAKIDKLIRQAGEKKPSALRAYNEANEHWSEDVAKRFRDNKVLEQFWKPEDLHNSMGDGLFPNVVGKGIHPNTALRVESFMKKINSPVDLEIVANAVPPEYSKVILSNKFADLMSEIGMDATKLTPERMKLLEASLGKGYGAVQARQVMNNAKDVLEMLKQRNIKAPYTEAELQRQSIGLADKISSLWKSIVALKTGNPMSLIQNAGDALTEQEKAKGAAAKMEALMKDYNAKVKSNVQK